MRNRQHPGPHSILVALAAAAVMAIGSIPIAASPVSAATRTVRLEAGWHVGFRFSTTGTVVASKGLGLSAPTTVSSDRRRVVAGQSGVWLRLTAGTLAGWEVRESLMAHVPGKEGDIAYSPAATITFPAGRYLGYRFEPDWSLASTRRSTTTVTTTGPASRRAVINGRPYVLMSGGAWAGYWIPVTAHGTRSAKRIACTVPARAPIGASAVYRRVSTTDREIALTLDMGGRLTPALDIMERLVIDRVCATIFPTGASASTTIGAGVLAMIKAYPYLFEVANHTQNHCNLRDGGTGSACSTTPPTAARIQKELLDAEAKIKAVTGRTTVPYWRPPYGAYDTRVRSAAAAVGFTKTMMWDIDTIDWRPVSDGGPTAKALADKVIKNGVTGSIVLMHLGGWNTLDALPWMVSRLRTARLEPTTISALLRPG